MSNSKIFIGSRLWQIGLAGIILWAAPSYLWGQETSLSQPTHLGAGGPFAGFDDSLTTAATALLDAASQTEPPEDSKNSIVRPALRYGLGPGPGTRSGPSVAAVRLNTLRPIVEPILRRYGVPDSLSAIILVESGGRAEALSPKGALGLWQLMPDTARRYGLRVDDTQDDRVDPVRATVAAARYLHDLYARFGDWKLALAAYNTGEVNVGNAISKAHSQDFDELARLGVLPLETRNYIPLVLAAIRSSGQLLPFTQDHERNTSIIIFASSNR